jgi:broad specificity phosphatase PhoE
MTATLHNDREGVLTNRLLAAVVATSILLSAACGKHSARSAHPDVTQPPLTFHLVRHAEKATDTTKDPGLSDAGRARAQRLRLRLRGAPLAAVYATAYRRTQATAAPTAHAHALEVRTYDAGESAIQFAARLRRTHTDGNVLVIGHSNTIAAIASALCDCEVKPLRDDEYDRWIEIRIDADAASSLRIERY